MCRLHWIQWADPDSGAETRRSSTAASRDCERTVRTRNSSEVSSSRTGNRAAADGPQRTEHYTGQEKFFYRMEASRQRSSSSSPSVVPWRQTTKRRGVATCCQWTLSSPRWLSSIPLLLNNILGLCGVLLASCCAAALCFVCVPCCVVLCFWARLLSDQLPDSTSWRSSLILMLGNKKTNH